MRVRVLDIPEVVNSDMWYNASSGQSFTVSAADNNWYMVLEDYNDFRNRIFNNVYNRGAIGNESHHFIKMKHAVEITQEFSLEEELFEI